MDLKVKIGPLELKNPIICASGTFGCADELKDLVNYRDIGAVVAKTITLKPKKGNPPPRIYETDCGVINSIGLENPGVEVFIKERLPRFRKLPTAHIVSIGGESQKEYMECLRLLDDCKGIDAYEINLSCPNVGQKRLFSQDARLTNHLLKELRKITTKPLIVKITPEVTDISQIALAIEEAGATAISLVNTFFALAINIETFKPYLGNIYGGYSARAIKPLALYRVWRIFCCTKLPLIAGGGIESANSAIEFFLAGATAISLGTVNLVSPDSASFILKGIKDYLKRKKIKDINELKKRFLFNAYG